MSSSYCFDTEEKFLEKLKERRLAGVPSGRLTTYTPFHIPEIEKILAEKRSPLKWFTMTGCTLGFITGFAFTIYTVFDWPLIVAGKPLISVPAYLIIAFELTILFGAIFSFFGFLLLAKIPALGEILAPFEHNNQFIIIEEDEVA